MNVFTQNTVQGQLTEAGMLSYEFMKNQFILPHFLREVLSSEENLAGWEHSNKNTYMVKVLVPVFATCGTYFLKDATPPLV